MKTLLVALLLFIVGAGTAYAECAWVVWGQWMGTLEETWSPEDSFTAPAPCKAAAEQRNRNRKANKLWFICLPDTLDPRGPKGK